MYWNWIMTYHINDIPGIIILFGSIIFLIRFSARILYYIFNEFPQKIFNSIVEMLNKYNTSEEMYWWKLASDHRLSTIDTVANEYKVTVIHKYMYGNIISHEKIVTVSPFTYKFALCTHTSTGIALERNRLPHAAYTTIPTSKIWLKIAFLYYAFQIDTLLYHAWYR